MMETEFHEYNSIFIFHQNLKLVSAAIVIYAAMEINLVRNIASKHMHSHNDNLKFLHVLQSYRSSLWNTSSKVMHKI